MGMENAYGVELLNSCIDLHIPYSVFNERAFGGMDGDALEMDARLDKVMEDEGNGAGRGVYINRDNTDTHKLEF